MNREREPFGQTSGVLADLAVELTRQQAGPIMAESVFERYLRANPRPPVYGPPTPTGFGGDVYVALDRYGDGRPVLSIDAGYERALLEPAATQALIDAIRHVAPTSWNLR